MNEVPTAERAVKFKPNISPIIQQGPERNPSLPGISAAHIFLEAKTREESWLNLHTRVQPYATGVELSDNIRTIVTEYVKTKIPTVKKRVPAFAELDDKNLVNALTNNWFEEVSQIEGTRDEVLLTVMAHVVKRIETYTYKEVLRKANSEELVALGLNPNLRDLTVELLDTATKVDPLFIRFKAMSHLTRKPRKAATKTKFFLPNDKTPYAFPTLFPKESQFLAERFKKLAEKPAAWQKEKNGELFKEYITELGKLYAEHIAGDKSTPDKAAEQQKKVGVLYEELLQTDFPITFTPTTDASMKEPYLDPELKVSLTTKDSQKEDPLFDHAKDAMVESLAVIGEERFQNAIKALTAHSVIVIGGYGVNLTLSPVAQEGPQVRLFLNEQLRTYDRNFHKYMATITNTGEAFRNIPPEAREDRMQFMSRMNSIFHEYAHSIHPAETEESNRLGEEPHTTINEMKAEIMFRPLLPSIIEKQGLEGTKEQWAIATLASALQQVHDQPDDTDDAYFAAGVYSLNSLFKEGVVIQEGEQFQITDYDAYYTVLKRDAFTVKALYENEDMTVEKAAEWIKAHATPCEELKRGIELVKSLKNL